MVGKERNALVILGNQHFLSVANNLREGLSILRKLSSRFHQLH
jgi:hypothetical protein